MNKGQAKEQLRQVILAFDLVILNFNKKNLTINFLRISNFYIQTSKTRKGHMGN